MASMASCWRWARVRSSLSIWAWVGVPVVQGSSSAGLHMPGAAYLAKITSHTAHAWGVKFALAGGHRVAALGGGGEVAFAGAFGVVGFGAVLIEQEQPQVGGLAQLFGPDAGRDAHQVHLELSRR